MWTEVRNRSGTVTAAGNSSKMVDPDLREQVAHTAPQQRNVSAATDPPHPPWTDEPGGRSSGIVPGLIAATVFIAFLLGLYAVLWKCMVSPPKRKRSKVRVRVHQRTSV